MIGTYREKILIYISQYKKKIISTLHKYSYLIRFVRALNSLIIL